MELNKFTIVEVATFSYTVIYKTPIYFDSYYNSLLINSTLFYFVFENLHDSIILNTLKLAMLKIKSIRLDYFVNYLIEQELVGNFK